MTERTKPPVAEYWRQVSDYQAVHPEQRRGQAAFNVLHQTRPDLSEKVRGTILDPFSRDDLLDEFGRWLTDHWS